MTNLPPDEVLINAYVSLGVSSDSIAQDASHRGAFINLLPEPYRGVVPDAIARRLIQLRKARKLPKLFRLQHSNP
jgi:hypothetical protein